MLAKARLVMNRENDDDPQSKVNRGFLEIASGNLNEATRLLQEATTAKVQRPDAHAELARIQLIEALDAPQGAEGRPSPAQMQPIRALLREALQLWPEMWLGHHLLTLSWSCSNEVPPADELRELILFASRYPEDSNMLCELALICERAGKLGDAVALARFGLAWKSVETNNRVWFSKQVTLRSLKELLRLTTLAEEKTPAAPAEPARTR